MQEVMIAVVSFRLGVADGVSMAAAQWVAALRDLGCRVRTIAGAGVADVLIPGLGPDDEHPPCPSRLAEACADADVVIVENVCSLPMNRQATAALTKVLRRRPAVLRHHDLPWERPHFAHLHGWLPRDPAWLHVAISEHSRAQLARRGVSAVTAYHGYADGLQSGHRIRTRRRLGVGHGEMLLLQPTRAIARKNVAAGITLAERLGATYWLTGPAEDGYGVELDRLLSAARCRVLRGLPDGACVADAYAAADAVVLPSTWEGFGMPLIESALFGRPLAVGDYPVAREVARLGFRWFPVHDPIPLATWLAAPDPALLHHNRELAHRHFGPDALRSRLLDLLRRVTLG
jgi:mannosylglucosylglycerate synthase